MKQLEIKNIVSKTESNYKEFLIMLRNYIIELHKYDPINVPIMDLKQLELEYLDNDIDSYKVLIDNDKYIGFTIISRKKKYNQNIELFIEEFYIKPEFRRKGYGKSFMNEILKKDINTVGFYILPKNENAKIFWNSIFNEWISVKKIKDPNNLEYVNWYVYRKKNTK